jgi:PAS domain S-box-containing protein
MKKQNQSKEKTGHLCKRAKKLLPRTHQDLDNISNINVRELIHKLRVHQIELEMQNEELRRAHSELEESRNKYADLYDFAPVGYFTLNDKGIILEVNLTGAASLGVERQNLINQAFYQFVDEESRSVFHLYLKRLIETSTRQACEIKISRSDSTSFHARIEGTAIHNDRGNFSNIRIAMVDITAWKYMEGVLQRIHEDLEKRLEKRGGELIKTSMELQTEATERRRAEKALREREEEYRNLFQNVPIGVYRTTPDGRILMANPALVQMLGYSSFDELSSHNLEEEGFQPTYQRSQFKELIEKENEVRGLESKWTRPDGTVIFIRENARAMREEDGTVLYYEGTIEDITQQKYAEERFRLVVESSPNGIVMTNRKGEITLVNPQAERMFGYSREELIGQSVEILVPERFRGGHSEYRTDFYASPQARPMGMGRDLFARRKDGQEFPVEIGLKPIKTDQGLVVLSVIVDITERKQAEQVLRESEERFRSMADSAPVMIWVSGKDKLCTYFNRSWLKFRGRTMEEESGNGWAEGVHPNDLERCLDTYISAFDARQEFKMEYRMRRHDGEYRWILDHGVPRFFPDGGFAGYIGSCIDITEQKRAEQALRENEEKLQTIINSTTDAILVYDEQGRVIIMNREAKRLFCNDGKELNTIWDIVPPEDRVSFSDRLRSVKEGDKLLDYETKKIRGDGRRIFVSIALTYMNQEGGAFIETIRDIGERVIMRNKVIELEKAQIVGKMAEGIAHHMGTPLASMLLRVQMLKEDMPRIPEYMGFTEKLDSIEKQIFYGQKVIQRLLRFVSKPQSERVPERIFILLEEAVDMIRPLSKRLGIDLELRIDGDLKVVADPNLLELVFLDLITNAVDAMQGGGKLSIIASKNGSEVAEILISDTGSGIPKEVLPFIFEPFFTTKPAGKGTGLGLSVAKRIIHDHGGEISIDSVEGKGTSVCIRLPIYKEEREIA